MKPCSSTSTASTSSSGDSNGSDPVEISCLSIPADLGLVLVQKDDPNFADLSNASNGAMPFLRSSSFYHVPPTILFYQKGTKVKKPPPQFASQLNWCNNSLLALVVRHSLAASHFKLVDETKPWIGYWGKHLKSAQYKGLKPHQKVNHFPGAFHLGRKDRLWQHLSEFVHRFEGDMFCVMPITYVLPKDARKLRAYLSMQTIRHIILKPPASARGTGISIVSRFQNVPSKVPLVAQHYIESPLIINGAKFDLRVYVLVTSYDPLRIYVYDEGLVRFASVAYSPALSSYSNQFMHLTNYSINKHAQSSGDSDEPVPKWRLSEFWTYLERQGYDASALRDDIHSVAVKAIISCESHIRAHAAHYSEYPFVSYELYGMDILVDANLRPWLIEMNISPSLHSSTPLDIGVKAPLAKDTLNMSGIPFPILSSGEEDMENSLYYRTRNLNSHKSEEQLVKERKNLEHFVQNLEIRTDILEDLTDADIRILVEFEDELARKGDYHLVYPTGESTLHFLRCMRSPLYSNLLLSSWQQFQSGGRVHGTQLLQKLTASGKHIARKRRSATSVSSSSEGVESASEGSKSEIRNKNEAMMNFRAISSLIFKRTAFRAPTGILCRKLLARNSTGLFAGRQLATLSDRSMIIGGAALCRRTFAAPAPHRDTVFEVESDEDFENGVYHAEKPVLMQFYADWCGPCQNLAPRLIAKVNGQDGKVLLARVNVEGSAGFLAEQFDVSSIPTVMCWLRGEVVDRFEGDVEDTKIDQIISKLVEYQTGNE